jgi:predicted AlkP superfamily pyrophosphatase or phosphodiesterase
MEIDPAHGPFSHAFGRASLYPNPRYYNAVFYSPFLESFLFDFAEQLVTEEALGSDDTIDVLALSFASVDTVGHRHGPNSRELLDTVLRLDRELGEFFRFLDETIGLDRIAISLSADHGVAPVPEYRAARGLPGARRSSEDYVCFQRAGQAFEKKFGDDDWFVRPFHFDYETLARHNVTRATLEAALKAELLKCPNIVQVWTRTEIEAGRTSVSSGPTLELFVHSFHPERSPDLYVVEKEFLVGSLSGTTHGSPYDYDTHVLALIKWPGAEPSSVSERIHTVDLPVTLAALLGVATPDDVDGVDRSKLIR